MCWDEMNMRKISKILLKKFCYFVLSRVLTSISFALDALYCVKKMETHTTWDAVFFCFSFDTKFRLGDEGVYTIWQVIKYNMRNQFNMIFPLTKIAVTHLIYLCVLECHTRDLCDTLLLVTHFTSLLKYRQIPFRFPMKYWYLSFVSRSDYVFFDKLNKFIFAPDKKTHTQMIYDIIRVLFPPKSLNWIVILSKSNYLTASWWCVYVSLSAARL